MLEKTTFIYPCPECEGDRLTMITDHPNIVECTICGHPSDTPSEYDEINYQERLTRLGLL